MKYTDNKANALNQHPIQQKFCKPVAFWSVWNAEKG